MRGENKRSVIVGIFVFIGIAILVTGVLTLGGQQKKFIQTIHVNAIFDDIGVVYGKSETQLIVLNPKCLSDVEMHINKYPIYEFINLASDELIKAASSFADSVETSKIKKEREGRFRNEKNILVPDYRIKKYIDFKKGENSVTVLVYSDRASKRNNEISFSILYSSPRLNYGSGAAYNYAKKEWYANSIKRITDDIKKVLTGEDERI
jgi:hypothetical protein